MFEEIQTDIEAFFASKADKFMTKRAKLSRALLSKLSVIIFLIRYMN